MLVMVERVWDALLVRSGGGGELDEACIYFTKSMLL